MNADPARSHVAMNSIRVERVALIAILLLAAYLRLNHLGWTEFKLDEANLSRLSLNLVRGVEFPLIGLGSSVGVPNLPLAPWLMAIPYAISSSPIVATGFIAVLNVVAVAGCYGLARRWLSTSEGSASGDASRGSRLQTTNSYIPALLATLMFAVAPWAVIHSRKIWAQDLLPPFVILWAWTGWLAFAQRRPRALIGHALALAACIQLHYSALWLIPVTLVWAIAFARRVQWKLALGAIGLFVAAFAPFLVADALRGGETFNRVLEIARQPAVVDDQALRLAWLMITGQEIHSLAGPQEFENFLASVPGGETGFALSTVLGVLVLAGGFVALIDVACAARRRVFDDRSASSFMMLTWLVVPVLMQSRHSLPVFTHYFIILYPVPFMLIGSLVARVATSGESVVPHPPAPSLEVNPQGRSRQHTSGEGRGEGHPLLTTARPERSRRVRGALLSLSKDEGSSSGEGLGPALRSPRPKGVGSEAEGVRPSPAHGSILQHGNRIRGAILWIGQWGLIAFSVITAMLQSIHSIALQQFVAGRATPGGFGVPVEMTMQVAAQAVKANRDLGGAEVLIYAEGDNPFTHEGPSVFDVLLPPNVPRRFVDLAQATEVYPLDAAVMVVYSPAGLPLPDALVERSALSRPKAVIPLRFGEGAAEIRIWPGRRGEMRYAICDTPIGRWQNGVALLDVRPSGEWQRSGGWIELCYQVGAEPDMVDVHWFNHVIGPDGQRWAQVDGVGYRAESWRPGDVITVRFGPFILPADAPAGRYTARIGMYTYPEIANVPLVDSAGNPVDDGVTVKLGELTR